MADIRLENVSYAYHDHGQIHTALENINIHIKDGEFVCILGSSGCGKTTLLRLIAGLQMPEQGTVFVGEKNVKGPGTDRAVVFQNHPLFPWMTAGKNVCFAIQQADKTCDKKTADKIAGEHLKAVGMEAAANKYPYQLSGGMKQRVAIAKALAMNADILLLDEPFGSLDAGNRQELQKLLLSLWTAGKKNKTIVFITHDIAEAILLADRILYMKPGQIVADISVKNKRPRNLREEDLEELQNRLWKMFYEDAKGGQENEASL